MTIEEAVGPLLAQCIDFREKPGTEQYLSRRYPQHVAQNYTLSPVAASWLLRTCEEAEPVAKLVRRHVLSPQDRKYVVENERRVPVRQALLESQPWSKEELLRLTFCTKNEQLAAYVVRNAERRGHSPLPSEIVEECRPEVRFGVLTASPLGSYLDEAPRWVEEFAAAPWGRAEKAECYAHLLAERSDLEAVMRNQSHRDYAASVAVCLSGLVHDAKTQIEDLQLTRLSSLERGTQEYEKEYDWWSSRYSALANDVARSPFTCLETIERIRDAKLPADPRGVWFCTQAIHALKKNGTIATDPRFVSLHDAHRIKDWLTSSFSYQFIAVAQYAMEPAFVQEPRLGTAARYGYDIGEIARSFEHMTTPSNEDGSFAAATRAQYFGSFDPVPTMHAVVVEKPFAHAWTRDTAETITAFESAFRDDVECYKAVIGLAPAWDGTVNELLATVKNLVE